MSASFCRTASCCSLAALRCILSRRCMRYSRSQCWHQTDLHHVKCKLPRPQACQADASVLQEQMHRVSKYLLLIQIFCRLYGESRLYTVLHTRHMLVTAVVPCSQCQGIRAKHNLVLTWLYACVRLALARVGSLGCRHLHFIYTNPTSPEASLALTEARLRTPCSGRFSRGDLDMPGGVQI